MVIGSTVASDPGLCLIDDTPTDNETYMDNEDASIGSQDDGHRVDDIYQSTVYGEIDFDDIMVNETHSIQFQCVDSTNLSKICRIDFDDSKRNLGVTTQTIV